jgi:hypothetical protein
MTEHTTQRRQRPGIAVLVPLALLASSAVVYQASNAAFTGTTATPSNTWASGTVSLTDNDSNIALFTAAGLKPGDSGTKCMVVTYTGSLTAAVRLYTTSYSDNGLAQYLTFTVDEGTGGDAACTGFTPGTNLYTGTLNGFSSKSSYATGVSAWAPAGGSGATKTYRFSWTLQDNDLAQNKSSAAMFTWEAQNT